MHGLTVTANANGGVKGYPGVADVILPPNAAGKLNVGGAIGSGVLSVIKDMGLKDPYVGQTELQTGEIAEDLTYYFAVSEQVPSSVGLGVLMNKDNTVRQAGGFIIQLMPFTEDAVIDALEQKIAQIASVTEMLEKGMTPEMILEEILGEMKLEINDTMPVAFHCAQWKATGIVSLISSFISPKISSKIISGVIPFSNISVTDAICAIFCSRASMTASSVNGIS